MIIATRGSGVFLSDKIGVINLRDGVHHPQSVESAARFGGWSEDIDKDPEVKAARKYENKHS